MGILIVSLAMVVLIVGRAQRKVPIQYLPHGRNNSWARPPLSR